MIQRGFCLSREFVGPLLTYGLSENDIWLEGRGAETLDWCIRSFRDRAGKLFIAPDLRVFGAARKQIAAVMAQLERSRIRVVDIIHPQDETISEMLHRAAVLIAGSRFGDKRTARRRGRQGGLARGEQAEAKRAEIAADWVIRNAVALVRDGRMTWDAVVDLFDGRISASTLRRHYGDAP